MEVSVNKPGTPEELVHFGVKGMRWGVRNARSSGSTGSGSKLKRAAKAIGRGADDTQFELMANTRAAHDRITTQASLKLRKDLPSIKARHGDYGRLRNRIRHPRSKEAKAYRADVKKTYLKHLESSANELTNIRGTRRYTLKDNGEPNSSQYFWEVSTESVSHSAVEGTFRVRPIFDDEGWIVDIEVVDDEIEQTIDLGINALIHMGIEVRR